MRLVNQVHVKSVTVLLLWCLLGAVTKHTAQKKDTKTRRRDGRGQEEGGGTSRGERTKESEAGVGGGGGGVRNKETKERKEERMKGHTLKRTNRRKSQSFRTEITQTTTTAGLFPGLRSILKSLQV